MSDISATLAERESRYGSFDEHARIAQAIKSAMADSPNWHRLAPDQREALEMVAHKAGRILNGDPNYHDNWHDIIGYVKLVADRLEQGDDPEVVPAMRSFNQTALAFEPIGEPREVGGHDIDSGTRLRPKDVDRDGPVPFL